MFDKTYKYPGDSLTRHAPFRVNPGLSVGSGQGRADPAAALILVVGRLPNITRPLPAT